MSIQLNAELRQGSTGSKGKHLRKRGRVPAVVYGKGMANQAVHLDENELVHILRSVSNPVIELNTSDRGKVTVMVSEVQKDPILNRVLHVDFQKINLNELIETKVPVHTSGEPLDKKGIVQMPLHEVEVRCLPTNIPSVLHIDITGMEMGDTKTLADIPLPEGVEWVSGTDEVVVTLLESRMPANEPNAAENDAFDDVNELVTKGEAIPDNR